MLQVGQMSNIKEQKPLTDGRIVVAGEKVFRRKQKRADYLLRFKHDFTIAVVEAKASYKNPGDGIQQAKDYAEDLGSQICLFYKWARHS